MSILLCRYSSLEFSHINVAVAIDDGRYVMGAQFFIAINDDLFLTVGCGKK